jgi:ABC-type nitrate/sulfonate/bicarbonate transport system substrate-binding protein
MSRGVSQRQTVLQSTAQTARVRDVQQIAVGSFTPSVLLDVAGSTGRLAEHGLEVREVAVSSSPAQFRSLLDGELAVALTSPDNVLAYRFNPHNPLGELADVRIVAAIDGGLGLGLYGRPGTNAEDLRGARVGVDVATSGFALALYALADSLGVARGEYELVALGSTPRRLEALLAGACTATMLNAGNELVAQARGCVRLAGVAESLAPYLGTVVAVAGEQHLDVAGRLSRALLDTAAEITGGGLTEEAAAAATRRLGLDDDLARRYVDRLRDAVDGLVPSGEVDRGALATLVRLRTTYLPTVVDGVEVLDAALAEGSGLVHARVRRA